MTITVNDTRNEYTASAGQTVFSYTFKIFADTDLNVYLTSAGTNPDDTTDLITAYTVSGVGDEDGGTITLTTPASAGDLITIVSDIPESRITDYQHNGDFRPAVVNDDFDRVVSLVKQAVERSNRGLAFQESQQNASGYSLPTPEAGYFLRWNGALNGLENVPFTSQSPGSDSLTVSSLANVTNASTGDWRYVLGKSSIGDGGHGPWVLTAGDFTSELASDTLNGVYLEYSGEDGSTRAWVRQYERLTPQMFGARGDGTTDDRDALYYADVMGKITFLEGTYRISSALTLSNDIVFEPDAKLSVDTAITVTVTGAVTANQTQQIFDGDGTCSGSFGGVDLWVGWFGAVADGDYSAATGTDNSGAFNLAITARTRSASQVNTIRVSNGIYLIENPVEIPEGVSFIGAGKWSTHLFCKSAYADNIIEFNGAGGPPTVFGGFSVNAQVGGAFSATGMAVDSNGTFVRDVWVNGLGIGVRLASTDVFFEDFAVELCTTGIYVTHTNINISYGTTYQCTNGIVVTNTAYGYQGRVVISDVRNVESTQSGMVIDSGRYVDLINCSSVSDSVGKFSVSGLTIKNAEEIDISNFTAKFASLTSGNNDGILISGTSRDISITNSTSHYFEYSCTITTSGTGISVTNSNFSWNGVSGIDATAWSGPTLILSNNQCNYNGGGGGSSDCGINVDMIGTYQLITLNGNIAINTGGGPQDYGIIINNDVATNYGAATGNATNLNNTAGFTVSGTSLANISVAANI